MGQFLVPFQGRNHSGASQQNFLWQENNIYVMDNHRAALWCWLQEIDPTQPHSLIHIDEHTDTRQSPMDEWLKHLPNLQNISINDYLGHNYPIGGDHTPLFVWDNYLSIYLELYGSNINRFLMATHGEGEDPQLKPTFQTLHWRIPENLELWLDKKCGPWIVNIDLDYFFCRDRNGTCMMVSDAYIDQCFTGLKQRLDDGAIKVVTICLTPDEPHTSGWAATEAIATKACRILGVDFSLP